MKKLISLLLFTLALSPWLNRARAQTALQAGDVLLLGYQTKGGTDFAFVPLVDLKPGTELRFTDNGWQADGGFHEIEGIVVYTAPAAGVPSGTVIGYQAQADDFTHPPQFQLRPEGDQVLAYQGANDKPTFVCALTYGHSWNGNPDPKDTMLPPGLKTGHSALYLPWNNGAYADDSPREAVADGLRDNLTDPDQWSGLDGAAVAWKNNRLVILPPKPVHEPVRLPVPPTGTDSLRLRLYHLLGSLDVSLVPTGYLDGAGLPLVPLAAFNGTLADSNRSSNNTWRLAYGTLVSSRVIGTNTLPLLDTLARRLKRARAASAVIPIALARIDYAAFRPDAVTAGLLTLQNGQLYDVPGRMQSPYEVHTMFVTGPAQRGSSTGNVSFVLPGNLYVQEGGGGLRRLELDFGAGQGYQPAAFDQPLALAYCAGTYRVKVRASYYLPGSAGGATAPYVSYESHFDFVVRDSTCGAVHRYADAITPVPFYANLTSSNPDLGATVYVRYGGSTVVGAPTYHTQLIKPLIVVEGYDPYFATPSLTEDENGVPQNYSIRDFLRDIGAANDGPISSLFNFRTALDSIARYDIVFIDFTDGTADIRGNAEVFKRVLRWVNSTKVNDPSTGHKNQNAVLGISMGGLVARYGLADMVKHPDVVNGVNQNDPDTYMLATQDSPHRGANTPLGLQALTRQAYNLTNLLTVGSILTPITLTPALLTVRVLFPQLDEGVTLLDEPATQQLLLLRATDGTGGTAENRFIDFYYQPMVTFHPNDPLHPNEPQPSYRFVTTSLGSACGTHTLNSHDELLYVDFGLFLGSGNFRTGPRLIATVNALPDYGNPDRISGLRAFAETRLPFGFTITHNLFSQTFESPDHVPNLDGLPGGTRTLSSQLSVSPGDHTFDYWLLSGGPNVRAVDRFCFVPTASALDIADLNASTLTGRYIGGAASASYSRATAFRAEPRGFEPYGGGTRSSFLHPFFRGRQAHWLFDELQRPAGNTTPNPEMCDPNQECSVVKPILTISGSTVICGPATYSVPAVAGAVYNWRVTPANAFSPGSALGSTSNTFTANATISSIATVSVEVVPPNSCRLLLTGSLSVAVCNPTALTLSLSYSNGNSCTFTSNGTTYSGYATWTAQAAGPYGPYRYDWYDLNYPNTLLYSSSFNTYSACVGNAPTAVRVKVYSQYPNPLFLGQADLYSNAPHRPSSTPPTFYPNPADTYTDVANQDAEGNSSSEPMQVTVYNGQGTPIFESPTVAASSLHLDTQTWPNGLYQVIIHHSSTQTSDQLSVQH